NDPRVAWHLQLARGYRFIGPRTDQSQRGVRVSELTDLYQEVILDHNRRPHNFRVIDPASAKQEGYNPLCGDRLTLYLTLDGDVIKDAAFQGQGCAIS